MSPALLITITHLCHMSVKCGVIRSEKVFKTRNFKHCTNVHKKNSLVLPVSYLMLPVIRTVVSSHRTTLNNFLSLLIRPLKHQQSQKIHHFLSTKSMKMSIFKCKSEFLAGCNSVRLSD